MPEPQFFYFDNDAFEKSQSTIYCPICGDAVIEMLNGIDADIVECPHLQFAKVDSEEYEFMSDDYEKRLSKIEMDEFDGDMKELLVAAVLTRKC